MTSFHNHIKLYFIKELFLGASKDGSYHLGPCLSGVDCHNKAPTTGWLRQQTFMFLPILKARNLKVSFF